MQLKAFIHSVVGSLAVGAVQVSSSSAPASATTWVSTTTTASSSSSATTLIGSLKGDASVSLIACFVGTLIAFVPPLSTVKAFAFDLICIQGQLPGGASIIIVG